MLLRIDYEAKWVIDDLLNCDSMIAYIERDVHKQINNATIIQHYQKMDQVFIPDSM